MPIIYASVRSDCDYVCNYSPVTCRSPVRAENTGNEWIPVSGQLVGAALGFNVENVTQTPRQTEISCGNI